MDDDQPIETMATAGFNDQRRFDDRDPARVLAFQTFQPFFLLGDDERMQDSVQARAPFCIGKDDGSQTRPVQRSI